MLRNKYELTRYIFKIKAKKTDPYRKYLERKLIEINENRLRSNFFLKFSSTIN